LLLPLSDYSPLRRQVMSLSSPQGRSDVAQATRLASFVSDLIVAAHSNLPSPRTFKYRENLNKLVSIYIYKHEEKKGPNQ